MTFVISNEYKTVLDAWLKEITSTELQPISMVFFAQNVEILNDFISSLETKDGGIDLIVERIKFMIQSITSIRKIKILNLVIEKKKVDSAFLTNTEKMFFTIFAAIEPMIKSDINFEKNLEIIESFSTLFHAGTKKSVDNELDLLKEASFIKVKAIKNIPEFIDNNIRFGPIEIGDVLDLPKTICTEILIPKGFVERI